MAQFGLLLFKNEVNINSQTWPLIHLTSLATFYSKTLLLKWVMPVKEYYQNFSLSDIHIMLPFCLKLTKGPMIIVKNYLRGVILSWRMLFKVASGVWSIRVWQKTWAIPILWPTMVHTLTQQINSIHKAQENIFSFITDQRMILLIQHHSTVLPPVSLNCS